MNDVFLKFLDSHWNDLLKEGKEIHFKSGQVLFYEGHNPYGVFILLKGEVWFSREKGLADDHRKFFPKGEVLGLDAFLDDKPYCCTCTANCPTRVIFISKTQLAPYNK